MFANVVDPVVVDATMPAGAVVLYALPTVSDPRTPGELLTVPILPTCTPAAGSTFAVGTTSVHCEAKDKADNPAEASFTVKVLSPVEQLDNLLPAVRGVGPGTSFDASVRTAKQALEGGNVNVAVSDLRALKNKVEAQSGKSITAAHAAGPLATADRIIHALGF